MHFPKWEPREQTGRRTQPQASIEAQISQAAPGTTRCCHTPAMTAHTDMPRAPPFSSPIRGDPLFPAPLRGLSASTGTAGLCQGGGLCHLHITPGPAQGISRALLSCCCRHPGPCSCAALGLRLGNQPVCWALSGSGVHAGPGPLRVSPHSPPPTPSLWGAPVPWLAAGSCALGSPAQLVVSSCTVLLSKF